MSANYDQLFEDALEHQNFSEWEQAAKLYTKALELQPKSSVTHFNRGNCWFDSGNFKKAVQDYTQAIEIDQDWADISINDAYLARANSHSEAGQYKAALEDYNFVIESEPNRAEAHLERGLCFRYLDQLDKALKDYQTALELQPEYPEAWYDLACWHAIQGQTQLALEYLQKVIPSQPQYRAQAKVDPDFTNINQETEFKKILQSD